MNQEQGILLAIVRAWHPSTQPEFRGFRCAACQEYMLGNIWHRWLDHSEFKCPIHFCSSCDSSFRAGKLKVAPVVTDLDREASGFIYPVKIADQFKAMVNRWPTAEDPICKEIVCDDCNKPLTKTQGFHIWWNDQGTLTELHLDASCATKFKISQ